MTKETAKTSVSDEEIAAAIIQTGSQRAAAKLLNISEKTIYNRLSNGNFQAVYANAKNEILRTAVNSLNEKLSDAIKVTAEIMDDKSANPQVRLQAARTIMDNAAKFTDTLTKNERATATQIEFSEDPLSSVHL